MIDPSKKGELLV
jgi:hypothetical protein